MSELSDDELLDIVADGLNKPAEAGKESAANYLMRLAYGEANTLTWTTLDANQHYYPLLKDERWEPRDGWEPVREWVAWDTRRRLTLWAQLFGRGDERQLILSTFGVPQPHGIGEYHAAIAADFIGFERWEWSPVRHGCIVVTQTHE